MKTARFFKDGRVHSGVLENGLIHDEAGVGHSPDGLQFLLPFTPGKVVGLALNYADHADELGLERPKEPVTFIKPNSALIPHRAPVVYPAGAQYMHYECELAVVIGRGARKVKAAEAMDHVKGYTIANDVTVRDFVGNMFRPPLKAKGWDTFGPLGPYLVSADEVGDPHALELRTYVNGELRQEGSTANLVFAVPEIIEFLTRFMTLGPHDVILTGTPKGLSHVHPGDTMRLEITGLEALENAIVEEVTR
ncbi:MAG: fumarylacetoacetate hydrolase family protein [Deinococcota bacterium]|nr:fumarylacetoacetate hydrolase family protein [Deinococcota bacterium]